MKKQALKSISILSLFAVLSVSAGNVSAFPNCQTCKPPVQYSASTSAQTAKPATAPEASSVTQRNAVSATSQPASSVDSSTFIWAQLALFFASLL